MEWQCAWCKYIININRERIRQMEAVLKDTNHQTCNICSDELKKELKKFQEKQEKNKRKKWRKIKL